MRDELEWHRVDATLDPEARDKAVDEFIELVGAVDGILQAQARNDADYFMHTSAIGRSDKTRDNAVLDAVLKPTAGKTSCPALDIRTL